MYSDTHNNYLFLFHFVDYIVHDPCLHWITYKLVHLFCYVLPRNIVAKRRENLPEKVHLRVHGMVQFLRILQRNFATKRRKVARSFAKNIDATHCREVLLEPLNVVDCSHVVVDGLIVGRLSMIYCGVVPGLHYYMLVVEWHIAGGFHDPLWGCTRLVL